MKTVLKRSLILCLCLLLLNAMPFAAAAADKCPHGATSWVYKSAQAATCTEDGNTASWYCSACKRFVKDSGEFNDAAVIPHPAGGHAWGAWSKKDDATHVRKCTNANCNEVQTEAHTWNAGVETKPASCKEAGEKTFTCTTCNATKTEAISKLAHEYVDTTFQPTCTEKGYVQHVCDKCGDRYTSNEVAALGHDWGEWTVTTAGDCSTPTTYARVCSRCSVKETKTDPTTGHKYVTTVVPATCETAGKTTHVCSVCGDSYDTDPVKPLGHHIVKKDAVPATCKSTGLTEGKICDREGCGKVFVEQRETPKTDHKIVTIPPIAATCQNEGRTAGSYCEYCETVFEESTVIPKTGHNYVESIVKLPSCTDDGLVRKTCTYCDDSKTEVVPATGHDFEVVVISAATCDEDGLCKKICKSCGLETDPEVLKAAGHKWSKKWTVEKAATCTDAGLKSHHCTVCDARNDVTVIPAAGHKYTADTTSIRPATTSKNGKVVKVCAVCGKGRIATVVSRIASIKLSASSFVCDGKTKKPTVVVKDADGNKLTKGVDYKLTYSSGRKKPGVYAVKVTFIGNYSGSKKLAFKIVPAAPKAVKAANDAKTGVTKIVCSGVVGAEKYVFYYATAKDGTYKKLGTSDTRVLTTKALKSGTYYFKVRAFASANGKVYGAFSPVCSVKVTPNVVYVPTDGTHYHLAGCHYLEGSRLLTMTVAEAKEMGKSPCSVCFG
ncbi:MAG: hypothetical protein IJL52_04695 [Clostridia bacterium]|nr:hypothetical protein [Clostridia bacterium]